MSMEHPIEITCPECGTKGSAMIHDSINVTLDPENKAKVLDQSLFLFRCEKCKAEVHLEYRTLYHDMREKYMIMVASDPDAARKENIALSEFEKLSMVSDGYRLRVVCRILGLIEKIRIFDSGLDEYAIELVKLMIYPQLNDPKEILFETASDHQLTFYVAYDDRAQNTGIEIDRIYYDNCKNFLAEINIDKNVQFVDMNFISKYLRKNADDAE